MTDYYCGTGGNDANSGLSYALRKLTLNACEDAPLVAGDRVFVAPGTYRETLTVDVSGSAGNPITYIGDVTGQNTDGIGGIVRITGSDDDQTATRNNVITATSKNYRTFRGFSLNVSNTNAMSLSTSCSNWIVEDCAFSENGAGQPVINVLGTGTSNTFRRCVFTAHNHIGIQFTHTSTVNDTAHIVENCLFYGIASNALNVIRIGGITVTNCGFYGCATSIRITTALAVGQVLTVLNCTIIGGTTGMQATTTAEFVEDYNNIFRAVTARASVTAGSNSTAHAPMLEMPIMSSGIRYPWNPFALSQFSTLTAKTGSSPASLDLFGITRPATNAKNSWGPVQYQPMLRETTTVHSSSAASLRLSDAGQHAMFVPVTAVSTTFSVYVQWEADYAGTKPQMIIRQPGQADTTVTATGSSGSWEQLTTTLTPAAAPGYAVVVFVSSNTATSGSYSAYFDSFTVA